MERLRFSQWPAFKTPNVKRFRLFRPAQAGRLPEHTCLATAGNGVNKKQRASSKDVKGSKLKADSKLMYILNLSELPKSDIIRE